MEMESTTANYSANKWAVSDLQTQRIGIFRSFVSHICASVCAFFVLMLSPLRIRCTHIPIRT